MEEAGGGRGDGRREGEEGGEETEGGEREVRVWVQREGGKEWECAVPARLRSGNADRCSMKLDPQSLLPGDQVSSVLASLRSARVWVLQVDLRPAPAEWVWALSPLLDGAGFVLAALMGRMKKEGSAVWAVASLHWAKTVVLLAAVLLFMEQEGEQRGRGLWKAWLGHALLSLCYGVAVVARQRWWVPLQATFSLAQVLLLLLLYWPAGPLAWRVLAVLGDVVIVVSCLVITLSRWAVQTSSLKLIAHDKERYDAIWRGLVHDDADSYLESLSDLVALIRSANTTDEPRQLRPIKEHLQSFDAASVSHLAAAPDTASLFFSSLPLSFPLSITRTVSGGAASVKQPSASPRALIVGNTAPCVPSAAKPESPMLPPPNAEPEMLPPPESEPQHVLADPETRAHMLEMDVLHAGKEAGDTHEPLFSRLASGPASRTASSAASHNTSRSLSLHDGMPLPTFGKERSDWAGGVGSLRRKSSASAHLPPIRSLDQVFSQATVMHHVLMAKAKEWAVVSEGMVRMQGGGFVKWADVCGREPLERRCMWAQMKSHDRAIEKQLRSYRGDPSRLVDVCRQAIVFSCLKDLQQCLETVQADPDTVIVRVKNRLDPALDAHESAGYRDVLLNLRLLTPGTSSLLLDRHVCELQLLLQQFASLKSNEGHRRYVQFRNSTCS